MKSLRTKLITICLLLLALPSLIIGTVGYQISKNQLEQSGKVQLKNDVRLVNGMIEVLDEQVKNGSLTLDEAQERVKTYILGKKDSQGQRPINKNIDIGENGYYFVVDETGKELANPKIEGQNLNGLKDQGGKAILDLEYQKPLAETLIKNAKNGGGFTYYNWQLPDNPDKTAEKITYSEMEPHWGWIVSAGSYMMDFNDGASQVLYTLIITLGVALLIGAIFTWIFSGRITRPIKLMADQARLVAEGDLTVKPIELKNKDEIGRLTQGFNTMVSSLRDLIFQVGSSAEQVAAASEQLTASAEQTSNSTEQIVATIQQVSAGSENQVNGVRESSATMNEISTGIGQIAYSTNQVSTSVLQTSNRAADGNETIQTAVKQMNSIQLTVNELAETVEGLGKRSQEIGQIIEVITDISSQTNLLALNAAIEAARAGEHGRGFAVVADEVRKLAEKSAESAQQIAQLIALIQSDTNLAVHSMDTATKEVAEGIGVVHTAGESFGHILSSINEVTLQIEEVSAAVEEMAAGTVQVDHSIKRISEIAENTAAGMHNVSTVAAEQSASMEEIASSSASLARMAEELNQSFQKFKI